MLPAEDNRCGDEWKEKRRQKIFKTAQIYALCVLEDVSWILQLPGTVLIPYILSIEAYYKADEVFSITDFKSNNSILTPAP